MGLFIPEVCAVNPRWAEEVKTLEVEEGNDTLLLGIRGWEGGGGISDYVSGSVTIEDKGSRLCRQF